MMRPPARVVVECCIAGRNPSPIAPPTNPMAPRIVSISSAGLPRCEMRSAINATSAPVATGALVALIADRISQRGKPALLIDTILGAIGFVGGAIGLGFLPAIQHSTTTRAGGLIIHTTTRNYSEAYQLAFGVASLMPILYEVLRYRRARRDGQTGVE